MTRRLLTTFLSRSVVVTVTTLSGCTGATSGYNNNPGGLSAPVIASFNASTGTIPIHLKRLF